MISEATVKLPNVKILNDIADFVVLSYINRNKMDIKGWPKTTYTKLAKEDAKEWVFTKEDLPYGIKQKIAIIVSARYDKPQYEAVMFPNEEYDDLYHMDFYMKQEAYTKRKGDIRELKAHILSNIRHEFVHLIQNYLTQDKGDISQAKAKMMKSRYSSGANDYMTSPVEFEAYLLSAIDEFVAKHKSFKTQQELNKEVVKYINSSDFFKAYKKAATKGKTLIKGYMDYEDNKIKMLIDYEQMKRKAIKKFYASKEVQNLLVTENEKTMKTLTDFIAEAGAGTHPMTGRGYCSVDKKTNEIKHVGDKASALAHVKSNPGHFLGYSPTKRKGQTFGAPVKEEADKVMPTIDFEPTITDVPGTKSPKKKNVSQYMNGNPYPQITDYRESVELTTEGYESKILGMLDDRGIDNCHFRNGVLYIPRYEDPKQIKAYLSEFGEFKKLPVIKTESVSVKTILTALSETRMTEGTGKVQCTKCDWKGTYSQVHTDRGGHNFLCPKCKAHVKMLREDLEDINENAQKVYDEWQKTRNAGNTFYTIGAAMKRVLSDKDIEQAGGAQKLHQDVNKILKTKQKDNENKRKLGENEVLDEISKGKAFDYAVKASNDMGKRSEEIKSTDTYGMENLTKLQKLINKQKKRDAGVNRAFDRIYKITAESNEDTETK